MFRRPFSVMIGNLALLCAHSNLSTVSLRSAHATLWRASSRTGITLAVRVPSVEQRFTAKAVSYAR